MSGTYPTDPKPSRIEMGSSSQTLISFSQSGKRFAREMAGQRWTISASYDALDNNKGRALVAFCASQKGVFETFQFIASHLQPRGVATGSPLVNGAAQVGTSVITDGWTASITGILKAGDILKFGNSPKIYMQTVDVNSSALGAVTLTLEPALILASTDNDIITVRDVPFTVSFESDVQKYPTRSSLYYSYEAQLVEVY